LQNTYKLKAISSALKSRIIKTGDGFIANVLEEATETPAEPEP
jgi:hypothetical protein